MFIQWQTSLLGSVIGLLTGKKQCGAQQTWGTPRGGTCTVVTCLLSLLAHLYFLVVDTQWLIYRGAPQDSKKKMQPTHDNTWQQQRQHITNNNTTTWQQQWQDTTNVFLYITHPFSFTVQNLHLERRYFIFHRKLKTQILVKNNVIQDHRVLSRDAAFNTQVEFFFRTLSGNLIDRVTTTVAVTSDINQIPML